MKSESFEKTRWPSRPRRQGNLWSFLLAMAVIAVAGVLIITQTVHMFRDRDETLGNHYHVKIDGTNAGPYIVRLPIPQNISKIYPADFVEGIDILQGNANFALDVFDHGVGLEVKANGSLEFQWVKAWKNPSNGGYGNLTMTFMETTTTATSMKQGYYTWIYSDGADMSIQFMYNHIYTSRSHTGWASGGGPTYSFIEYPNGTGWQQTQIDCGQLIIN